MKQPGKPIIRSIQVWGTALAGAALLAWGLIRLGGDREGARTMLKSIDELRVRITSSTVVPDPARIANTGDWYFLDHVSSGLASFDSEKKKFVPMLASSWSTTADGFHHFKLKPGIRFHDGTPIEAKDFIWSLKRQLILKSSTHFPLWDYIVGCEGLKHLNDECEGLSSEAPGEITIRLKVLTDSFFLQLASPETGVFSASDMNPETAELRPTKFSGAYFVESRTEEFALLRRNSHSPISQAFPDSPRSIRIVKLPLSQIDQALVEKKVDLVFRSYRPLGERDWKKDGIAVQSTTPSTILYLYGTGRGKHLAVGRKFIEELWRINRDPVLTPADTFLPFSGQYSLTRDDFLSQLPPETAPKLRVLCPEGFFSQGFTDQIVQAARNVGVEIQFSSLPGPKWFPAFDDPKASDEYDFILGSYAASERYPAVQLRYITGGLAHPPIDLKKAESPDLTPDRVSLLVDYQRWLLKNFQVIPLFFNRTLFLHREGIDLGAQPSTDAEIELWRVQARLKS